MRRRGQALSVAGVAPRQVERVAVATLDLYWRPEPVGMNGFFDADWSSTKKLMLTISSVMSRATAGSPAARRGY